MYVGGQPSEVAGFQVNSSPRSLYYMWTFLCTVLCIRQYKLVDLDYGFTYPKLFLDLEKTFIFKNTYF